MRTHQLVKRGLATIYFVIVGLLILSGPMSSCGSDPQVAPNVPPLTSVPTTSAPPESPSPTASASPTPTTSTPSLPVETLCGRVDQDLVQRMFGVRSVSEDPRPIPAEIGLPAYDVCALRLAGAEPLRVGISVLPATITQLTAARKSYDAGRGTLEPSKPVPVGQGGYGTSRFVVFLGDGRLVKLSGPALALTSYTALARNAAAQLPGLPPPAAISRSECDRGSSAAAKVLGATPAARRDFLGSDGIVTCSWLTATAVLSAEASATPSAVQAYETARRSPTAEPVPLGDDAFLDPRTRTVRIRTGSRVATLTPYPPTTTDRDTMLAFALSISPLYTR